MSLLLERHKHELRFVHLSQGAGAAPPGPPDRLLRRWLGLPRVLSPRKRAGGAFCADVMLSGGAWGPRGRDMTCVASDLWFDGHLPCDLARVLFFPPQACPPFHPYRWGIRQGKPGRDPWPPAGCEPRPVGFGGGPLQLAHLGLSPVLSCGGRMRTAPTSRLPRRFPLLPRTSSVFCCLVGRNLGVCTAGHQPWVLTFKHEFYFAGRFP